MVNTNIYFWDASQQNALFFDKCAPPQNALMPQSLEQALHIYIYIYT